MRVEVRQRYVRIKNLQGRGVHQEKAIYTGGLGGHSRGPREVTRLRRGELWSKLHNGTRVSITNDK